MTEITQEALEEVAGLAQLALNEQEKKMFRTNMQDVLGYFDTLSQVDTDNVPEIGHITGMEDVYRADVVHEKSDQEREALMKNVPNAEDGYIAVKNVL